MKQRSRIIFIGIGMIGVLFAVGYYFNLITQQFAFPVVLFSLGIFGLYNGIFLISKHRLIEKIISILSGGVLFFMWLMLYSGLI